MELNVEKTSAVEENGDTFRCDKCGKCCQNLHLNSLYADLDRGDGVCIYYDEEHKLCKIYEHRPLICNVDEMYRTYFYQFIDKKMYYEQNYAICKKLKET